MSECVHCILMRSPGAQGCAVNVYVLTAVKLWLETFALAAALHSATDIGVCLRVCVPQYSVSMHHQGCKYYLDCNPNCQLLSLNYFKKVKKT